MVTISLKVPDTLDSRLAEKARRRRSSKSGVIRECVEKALPAPRKDCAASCFDLARDLAGCLKGPRDIATNPKYLKEQDATAIGDLLGRAAEDVQEFDAIMHNKYARLPEKLRAWQSASRVERAPQREKKPDSGTAAQK